MFGRSNSKRYLMILIMISPIQLKANGVSSGSGPSALLLVERVPEPGLEPAPILSLLTVELHVREKVLKHKDALGIAYQVIQY